VVTSVVAALALGAYIALSAPIVWAAGIDGGYVGTTACLTCHDGAPAADKTSFLKSGHPYKLRTTKGLAPVLSGGDGTTTITDPLSAILPMPLGTWINTLSLGDGCYDAGGNPTSLVVCDITGKLDWSAVQYVIGGFGWKARWGLRDTGITGHDCSDIGADCKTGYVLTGADGTGGNGNGPQYNLLAADPTLDPLGHIEDWSDYNNNTNKGYDCAQCHNTNGSSYGDQQCTTSGSFGYRTRPWLDMGRAPAIPMPNIGGFKSEWTFDGVQCEACHGRGSNGSGMDTGHADLGASVPQQVLAITDSTATGLTTASIAASPFSSYTSALAGKVEICAKCHMRGTMVTGGQEWGCAPDMKTLRYGAEMAGSSGTNAYWLKHHEQYHEVVGYNPSSTDFDPSHGDGVHAALRCSTCHDAHIRTHQVTGEVADAMGITDNDESALSRGAIVRDCESCHAPGTPNAAGGGADTKAGGIRYPMGDTDCVDCHMAEATKSAPNNGDVGTWGKKADVKTHIFAIDTTATSIVRTNADGKPIAQNYLTVDYACGKCHDPGMNDYSGYPLTRAMAQEFALNIHDAPPPVYPTTFSYAINGLTVDVSAVVECYGPCPTFTYDWDWGDGSAHATTDPASHGYGSTGKKSITLTVRLDSNGDKIGMVTRSVTLMSPDLAPTVANTSCTINTNTWVGTLVDSSTDDGPDANTLADDGTVNAVVDWGDGTAKGFGPGGTTFNHTYGLPGTYTIAHKAIDSKLQAASESCAPVALAYFTISGTIYKSDGTTPVPSATVTLKKGGVVVKTVYSAANGMFSAGGLKPGTYTLSVIRAGYTFAMPAATITVGPSSPGNAINAVTP
jgi:hypothetical protein